MKMKQRIKRFISSLLCIAMLLTALPMGIFAANVETTDGLSSNWTEIPAGDYDNTGMTQGTVSVDDAGAITLAAPQGMWWPQAGVVNNEKVTVDGAEFVLNANAFTDTSPNGYFGIHFSAEKPETFSVYGIFGGRTYSPMVSDASKTVSFMVYGTTLKVWVEGAYIAYDCSNMVLEENTDFTVKFFVENGNVKFLVNGNILATADGEEIAIPVSGITDENGKAYLTLAAVGYGGSGTDGGTVKTINGLPANIFRGEPSTNESSPEIPESYTPIYTKEDLDAVRNNLSGNYILMNDIVFTEEDFAVGGAFYNDGMGFEPIGDSSYPFTGIFDGNGYAIKNIYINIDSTSRVYAGLFGYNRGTVKNLGLEDGSVTATASDVDAHAYAGGIAAYNSYDGTIENCYNTGEVTATVTATASYHASAGGIAGYNEGGTLTNCYNTGDVTATASTYAYAGGIAGYSNYGTLTNCYNTGEVTATATSTLVHARAGGIVGVNNYGTPTNCYNTGTVTATVTSTSSYPYAYAGGIAGFNDGGTLTNCYNTGKVTATVTSTSTSIYTYASAGGIAGRNCDGTLTDCYNTGTVTVTASYHASAGGIAGDNYCGTITNCYNTGEVTATSSYAYAGGIVGYNHTDGTIENCYNTGTVTATVTATSSYTYAGGIAGYNNYGTLTNCYYLDNISDGVGYNTVNGTCVKCTAAEMQKQATFVGFDFDTVWEINPDAEYKYPTLRVFSSDNDDNNGNVDDDTNGDEDDDEPIVGENLALNATIYAESTALDGNNVPRTDLAPELAVDGDYCTRWQAHTEAEGGNTTWIALDFGTAKTFDRLRVYWETARANADGYTVQVSDNGTDWTDVLATITRTDDYVVNNINTFYDQISLGSAQNARYVRLYITDGNGKGAQSICEFEVYAPVDNDDGEDDNDDDNTGDTTEIPEGYTPIYTKEDLDAVRNNLSGNYILMNDIVFTEEDFAEGGAFYNDGMGFEPIGTFAGTFDGNGYAIKNIYINIGQGAFIKAGLFSQNTGNIKNLGMVDGSITVLSSYDACVGGIVATNAGTIDNCYNTCTITVTAISSEKATSVTAGGIAGVDWSGNIVNCYNMGDIIAVSISDTLYASADVGGVLGNSGYETTMKNCYNTGDITVTAVSNDTEFGEVKGGIANAGGIIGALDEGKEIAGSITECYNTGDVTVTPFGYKAYVGGIAGWINYNGIINNCYNNGTVTASLSVYSYAGGVVGYSCYGIITNCYNIGAVIAKSVADDYIEDYACGVVGYKDNGTVANCYYLQNASIGVGNGEDTCEKCTADEMQQQATFVGFDFDTVWEINPDADYPYPTLQAITHIDVEDEEPEITVEFAGGNGTEEDPYLINTKEQLDNVRNNLDAHYKLIADIVFTEDDFAEGGAFYNDGAGFQPIGRNANFSFTGTFDGNGYAIKNIYINIDSTSTAYAGLFGYNRGTVKNLGLEDGIIISSGSAGGIAASNQGIISDCYNTCSITAIGSAGGITALNDGIISKCYNTGSISGMGYEGGIAGGNIGEIRACYNTGSVSGSEESEWVNDVFVGGIVGMNESDVADCYNTGSVTATDDDNYCFAGGIAGENGGSGSLINCYNVGDVTAISENISVDGIVANNEGTCTNCYSLDNVSTVNGTNCTAEEMQQQETFVGFDFDTVWAIDSATDYPYPTLQGLPHVESDNTEEPSVVLESISVTVKPNKLTYIEGDVLDVTGMVVTAYYSDGTSEIITDYMVGGYDSTPGTKTITVTYEGMTATFTVEVKAKKLTHIAITKKPDKLSYIEGQLLDNTGMVVTAYYDNGTSEIISDYTVSGYDSTPGTKTIAVTYEDMTTTFIATFIVEVVAKSLTGISVTTKPNKLTYLEGESFDKSGMVVTAYYDNGTSEIITDYTVSGYDSTPGTKTITVTYRGKTTTFTVAVNQKEVINIAVTRLPNKLTYVEGEEFDPTGMVVTAYYEDGTSAVVTGYSIDINDSVPGKWDVIIIYNGRPTILEVEVVQKELAYIEVTVRPNKLTYLEGESFNNTGMVVTAYYNNSTPEEITDYTISGYDSTKGIKTITVMYNDKTATFTVTVIDRNDYYIPIEGNNIAFDGTAIADSVHGAYSDLGAENANDGDLSTRWQSNALGHNGDDAWIGIMWEEAKAIGTIYIDWELPHPSENGFKVQISDDGVNWVDTPFTAVRIDTEGDDHQKDIITLTDTPITKYVRVYCFKAYTNINGYVKDCTSCYEFEVYELKFVTNVEILWTYDDPHVINRDQLYVGGEILVTYNTGATKTIEITPDMVSGFDNSILGKQTLTVTYEGQSDTYEIEIIPNIKEINIIVKPGNIGESIFSSEVTIETKPECNHNISRGYVWLVSDDGIHFTEDIGDGIIEAGKYYAVCCRAGSDLIGGYDEDTVWLYNGRPLNGRYVTLYEVYEGQRYEWEEYVDFIFCPMDSSGNVVHTYDDPYDTSCNICDEIRNVEGIEITSMPDKLVYFEDEELDLTGMIITVNYDNGTSEIITDYTVSGYDTTFGVKTITVNYNGVTATFEVTVKECKLEYIAVIKTPDKVVYIEGMPFDSTGMIVMAFYDNGEYKIVTDYVISGYDATVGTKVILVTYGDMVSTFNVEVIEKSLTHIEIETLPDKLVYYEGEELDTVGMDVVAYYNNGTSEIITDYIISGYDSTPGIKTITVTYEGMTATFEVEVKAKKLTHIAVTKKPDKLNYIEGQPLDNTGMVVTAYYSNGTSEIITDYTVREFSLSFNVKTVIVVYQGMTSTFTVNVREKSLVRIEVTKSPDKLNYIEGESFDMTGMVITAYYDNGTSETITDYTVSGYDPTPGMKTMIVVYRGMTSAFSVNVREKMLVSIEITAKPDKLVYSESEDFDATGMVITGYYDNGTSETITDYTVSGYDHIPGVKTITVSFNGKTSEFTVEIIAKTCASIVKQPKDSFAANGEKAIATVVAIGDGLTYQWYVKNPNGTKFNKSSITDATYFFTMSSSYNGRQIYCVITDEYGNSVQTETVTIRMSASVKTQPVDTEVSNGEVATVTVVAIGDGLTYQWYVKNPSGTKFNKSSITTATYSFTMSSGYNGRQVYCVITDKYGNSVTTDIATITILENTVTIVEQPEDAVVSSGEKAIATVVAIGDGLTYQWYVKNPNGTKFNKSSITTATYSFTMSSGYNGRQVYCVITDKYGNSVTTETVTLSMN